MIFKAGEELSRRAIGTTLAGDGLLIRLRSTSIGLLGAVAATGLGLIAFAANQDWPGAFNSPIPPAPPALSAVDDAVALDAAAATGPASRVGYGTAREDEQVRARSDRAGDSARLAEADAVSARRPAQTPTPAPTQAAPTPAPPSPPAPTGAPTQTTQETPAATAPSASPLSPATSTTSPPGRSKGAAGRGKAKVEAPPQSVPAATPPSAESDSAVESPGRGHAYGKSGKPEH